MRSVWVWCGHNDFPFRVLPMQHARRSYCTNRIQECLCGEAQFRDLNCYGPKQNAKISTNKYGCECNWRMHAQKEKCGLCGAGICTPPARMSANGGSSEALPTFGCKQSWIYFFIATTHPTTNSSTSHSIETKKMGVLAALPA